MSGAVTATVAVVAAMTAAEVFTAIAITGAVVGAVGMVTGSKELKIAGMVLGAVGGIGALATSAGLFAGEAAAGLADISGAYADIEGITAQATAAYGPEMLGMPQQMGIPSEYAFTGDDIINGVIGDWSSPVAATDPLNVAQANVTPQYAVEPALANTQAQAAAAKSPSEVYSDFDVNKGASQQLGSGDMAQALPAPVTPVTPVSTAPVAPGARAPTVDVTEGMLVGTKVPAPTPTPPTPDPGLWASLYGAAKDNPLLAYGALQGTTAFISGVFKGGADSALTPAQIEYYQAHAAANHAAANISRIQASNMESSLPVARRVPRAPVVGMINRASV